MTTHAALRHLGRAADLTWTAFRWGVYYVLPLSIAIAVILTYVTVPGHQAGAYCLLAALFVAGVALAIAGSLDRRPVKPRQRSTSVRRINWRAAWILTASAVTLATIMGMLAVATV